jgi:sarcosine oxidase delta subunit
LIVLDEKGSLVAAMACKKINESDVNKDYFDHHQGEARSLDTTLTSSNPSVNRFLHKVENTISKAEEQLSHMKACDRFILMDFTFDIHVHFLREEVIRFIKAEGDKLRSEGIMLIACENFEVDKPIFSCL